MHTVGQHTAPAVNCNAHCRKAYVTCSTWASSPALTVSYLHLPTLLSCGLNSMDATRMLICASLPRMRPAFSRICNFHHEIVALHVLRCFARAMLCRLSESVFCVATGAPSHDSIWLGTCSLLWNPDHSTAAQHRNVILRSRRSCILCELSFE